MLLAERKRETNETGIDKAAAFLLEIAAKFLQFRYTEEGEYLSDHLHISGISEEEQHLLPNLVF